MKLKRYSYKKVESTNNVAIRLIKQGNQRGIILTDQQTKGKGQGKNRWISIKGNLFISIFFEINKKIYLTDTGKNRVQIYNCETKKIESFIDIGSKRNNRNHVNAIYVYKNKNKLPLLDIQLFFLCPLPFVC